MAAEKSSLNERWAAARFKSPAFRLPRRSSGNCDPLEQRLQDVGRCFPFPKEKDAGHWFTVPASSHIIFSLICLCLVGLLVLPGLIPERQFDPIPQAEFVVDYAEVVLDNVFGSAEGIRNFPVLAAFGDKLDDGMFSLAGSSGVDCFSDHSCLL